MLYCELIKINRNTFCASISESYKSIFYEVSLFGDIFGI